MEKKLTKHGNSWALIIDKPILELLKINEKSVLELSVEDSRLIVRLKKISSKKNDSEVLKAAKEIIEQYRPVFEKLSKT